MAELTVYVARLAVSVERGTREAAWYYAVEGDWAPLAKYIREGGRITPQMRTFLADVLDGTLRRPAKKISKAKTHTRDVELVLFIKEARERRERGVPQKAEQRFGRTWRQLQKILAAQDKAGVEKALQPIKYMDSEVNSLLSMLDRPGWEQEKAEWEKKWGVIKYPVSDMALTPHSLT
ncbi:MAG TPA: hypothetical protein VKG24_25190 [Pseudolabrys sp.]|nr:hypothetical protein [Pseudolabrys sp.]